MSTGENVGTAAAGLQEIRNVLKTQTLNSVREILSDARVDAAVEKAEYEFRERTITPVVTILHMVLAAIWPEDSYEASWQVVWDWMASRLPGAEGQSPSSGSVAKARKRVPLAVWDHLFSSVSECGQKLAKSVKNWRGLRVMLLDGTTVSMPAEPCLFQAFGRGRGKGGKYKYPLARMVALSLADTMMVVGYRLGRYRTSEWALARPLLSMLKPGDLLLADRHFAAAHYYAMYRARGFDYLTRAHQRLRIDRLQRTVEHNPEDFEAEVPINPKNRRADPSLPETVTVRFIRAKIRIRGKRERIWLATSLLDARKYPAVDLVSLYARRWRIETLLRQVKVDLGADVLRSLTPEGIRKELAARLLAMNIVRTLMLQAARKHGADPTRLSFVGALRAILAYAPAMATAPVWQLPAIRESMLTTIASHQVPDRPGRNEPRAVRRERKHYPSLPSTRAQWKLKHAS